MATVGGMRSAAGILLGSLVVLALAGCVGGTPLPPLPPTPTSTPLFASEEEALAAAEEAYAEYLAMSNLISSEGGEDPERIAQVAGRELVDSSLEGFETLQENQWRTVGVSSVVSAVLQYVDLGAQTPAEAVLAAYLCVDLSGLDVQDVDGNSVVSSDRPDLQAFEVFFDAPKAGQLVPAEREPWGTEVCGP